MSDKVVNSIIKKLYINPLRKRAAATAAAAKAAKAAKTSKVINSLFSKLSLKNTSVKTRASKAAVTRKLNKLKEQEESLKLILKARTRYQLKKLDLTHSSKF